MKTPSAPKITEGTSSNIDSLPLSKQEELFQHIRGMPSAQVHELMEILMEQRKKEKEGSPNKNREEGEKESHAKSPRSKEPQKKLKEKNAAVASPSKKVSTASPDSVVQKPSSDPIREKEKIIESEQKRTAVLGSEPRPKRIKMKARKGLRTVIPTDSEEEGDSDTSAKYQEEEEDMKKMKASGTKSGTKRKLIDPPEIRRSSRIGLKKVNRSTDNAPQIISDDDEDKINERKAAEEEKKKREAAIADRIAVLQKLEIKGERGFSSSAGDLPKFITEIIHQQEWENFCEQPPVAFTTLVVDFYGHLAFEEGTSFRLYGSKVSCGEKDINAAYNIFIEGEMEGNIIMNKPTEEQMHEALQLLTRKGTKWNHSARGARSILAAELQKEPAVWLNFIRNRICPTTHYTTVSLDKVMLLYCLFKGIRINVGLIISNELKEIAKKTVGSLFFPSLITLLCQAAFIPKRGEPIQTKPMDLAAVNVLLKLSDTKALKHLSNPQSSSAPQKKETADPSVKHYFSKLNAKLCTYFKYCQQRDEGMKAMFSEVFDISSHNIPPFLAELLKGELSDDDSNSA